MGSISRKKPSKDPQEAKWLVGHCDGVPVYVSLGKSRVVLGPLRSGKCVRSAGEGGE